jgi:hypothetical protein
MILLKNPRNASTMLSMNGKISNDLNRPVHPETLEGGTEDFSAESMINES